MALCMKSQVPVVHVRRGAYCHVPMVAVASPARALPTNSRCRSPRICRALVQVTPALPSRCQSQQTAAHLSQPATVWSATSTSVAHPRPQVVHLHARRIPIGKEADVGLPVTRSPPPEEERAAGPSPASPGAAPASPAGSELSMLRAALAELEELQPGCSGRGAALALVQRGLAALERLEACGDAAA
mmetsp:Transcript_14744/g.42995  ORF Transcript_14744/g.42995 Transcript_14744/m.42995 type:complete len:187 (+) Transcript_14744:181-741(+)